MIVDDECQIAYELELWKRAEQAKHEAKWKEVPVLLFFVCYVIVCWCLCEQEERRRLDELENEWKQQEAIRQQVCVLCFYVFVFRVRACM